MTENNILPETRQGRKETGSKNIIQNNFPLAPWRNRIVFVVDDDVSCYCKVNCCVFYLWRGIRLSIS